jgi:hypothetical protein
MSRPGDQVPTSWTTSPAIMRQLTFALGVADARAGRPFHHRSRLIGRRSVALL